MAEPRPLAAKTIGFLFAAIVLLGVAGNNSGSRSVTAEPNLSSDPLTQKLDFRGMARTPWNTADQLKLQAPRIVVNKADRKLFLYSGNTLVRTYRVGLGLSPLGDKVRQGDRRTPEGDYYVFVKNDKSAFYLSLGLSYPNQTHAERGLRDGLINKAQYDAILRAQKAKRTPPQNTPLGGDIYIHGNGAGSDWTLGCVALEDSDMRELFNAVSVGTPVIIKP